jgi:hypothetical protein
MTFRCGVLYQIIREYSLGSGKAPTAFRQPGGPRLSAPEPRQVTAAGNTVLALNIRLEHDGRHACAFIGHPIHFSTLGQCQVLYLSWNILLRQGATTCGLGELWR